ncbi:MAG: hypothetical protein ACR2NB_14830 [Solirubrobacteraceae bacterium]
MTDAALRRLADADPHPLRPLSEAEQRETDALLARILATSPVAEPGTATARTRPRLPRLAPALAAACAVALAAILLLGGRGPGVAERAYAAVTSGTLYHLVALGKIDGQPRSVLDSYYDTVRPAFHNRQYGVRDGRRRLIAEFAGDERGTRSYVRGFSGVAVNRQDRPRAFDPLADFKRAYRSGRVRSEGTVTVDGRKAYKLVVDDGPRGRANSDDPVRLSRSTYIVDAKTYLPIEQRGEAVVALDGPPRRIRAVIRYAVAERLPRTQENLRNLEMRHSGRESLGG